MNATIYTFLVLFGLAVVVASALITLMALLFLGNAQRLHLLLTSLLYGIYVVILSLLLSLHYEGVSWFVMTLVFGMCTAFGLVVALIDSKRVRVVVIKKKEEL